VKKFSSNPGIVFGDVNLSKNQVRIGQPGAGGWPTVRHFNKKTGYDGEAYKQKTQEAMCTELGPGKPYLQQYIEEFVSLCSTKTQDGCSEREKKFIDMWKAKGASVADIEKQIKRLEGMASSSMKAELMQWLRQRLSIFKQLKTEL